MKKEISTFTSSVTIFLATQAFHDNILHAYICKTGSNPTIVLQDIAISAIFVVSYLSLGFQWLCLLLHGGTSKVHWM